MKNFYFKVNRRHIGIIVLVLFVVVSINALFVIRVVHAANPAQTILQLFFPATDHGNSPGGGGNPTPGANITMTPGVAIPAGFVEVPAGHCQDKLTQALGNLRRVKSQVLPVYVQASQDSANPPGPQIPWEIFAAIHYVETGGSFNPNGSLISGRPIGDPEPDQGGVRYTSLLDSAHAAARVFRQKGEYVRYYNRVNNMTPATGIELIAGQFALYNAITQGECAIEEGINGYNGKYAGGTWSGITDNGQCNGGGGPMTHTKGEAFIGDRHVYPSYCKDSAHQTMYFHFHYGGRIIPYTNRVGTLALIWGIQNDPEFRSISSTSPTTTPPAGTGFLRNPTDSGLISNEVIQRCQVGDKVTISKMNECKGQLQSVSDRFRDMILSNSSYSPYLQCVAFSAGLANEINGAVPRLDDACFMKNQSSSSAYRYIQKGSSPPLPGDLVIWDSRNSSDPCTHDHVGHIAYVASVRNPGTIVVAEANINYYGKVAYRDRATTFPNMVGWLRKK